MRSSDGGDAMSWRPSGAAAVVAAAAVAVLVALLPAAPASAGPDLVKARAQAAALRVEVDRLDAEAEAAAEDYGAANDTLGAVVTRLVLANQAVDTTQQAANAASDRKDAVAAQLYMSGGPSAIYSSVLSGTDISDVLDRIASVDSVVRGEIVSTTDAQAQAVGARLTATDLALLAAQRRVLEDRVIAAAQRVAALQQQAAADLANADALVRSLVESERAAAQAAAEAAAARLLTNQVPWTSNAVPADSYAAVDRAIAEATAAPATPWAVGAITDARRWLGTPYSAGGGNLDGPTTGWCSSSAPDNGRDSSGACAAQNTVGFDCSSLMVRIFHAAGRSLPRTSRQQWKIGVHVALADLRPGDLLFWASDLSNPGSIHHVALYIGHGLMVQAPHTGGHVEVAAVYLNGLIGAVRPV
jgi:cell wall-associated NlpC family hydrolase